MRALVTSLILLTALAGPAAAEDVVVIDGYLWAALQPIEAPEPDPLPGPFAANRSVRLEASPDGRVALEARWRIDTFEPGWLDLVLLGAAPDDAVVTWGGGPAAWDTTGAGVTVTGWVDGPVVVSLTASLPGDPRNGTVQLPLAPAVRGDVVVAPTAGYAPVVGGALKLPSGAWTGADTLSLGFRPDAGERDRGTLAFGGVGVGLTVGDTEVSGQARLRWRVQHGQLDRLEFTASGIGADVEVTGTTVRSVQRSGDRFVVELQSPATALVTLDLRWTAPLPSSNEARVAVPSFSLQSAGRIEEAALQLARDGDWQALPDLRGWHGRSASALPPWARGLVSGTPTGAFDGSPTGRGGELVLLRFEPVSGPPIIVDVADFVIATTEEGRQLVRVRYDVRNDTGHELLVTPPPGARLLAAQVRGEATTPVRRGGRLAIRLPRSVETVEGLISLPVEIAFLVEDEPWGRREERELQLPAVDAPVAASRVSLHLPPGYVEARRRPGRRVDSFTEGGGIAYGFAVTDETSRNQADQADTLFQSAVDAWLDNDFDGAQDRLDDLSELGASNDNTVRLQSNIDVVAGFNGDEDAEGRDEESPISPEQAQARPAAKAPAAEQALRRRVREQARARSEHEFRAYEETRREAERREATGDYTGAEEQYREALELGKKLEGLEQEESTEIADDNIRLDAQLAEVRTKKKAKRDRDDRARGPAAPPPEPRASPVERRGLGGLGSMGTGRGGGGSRGSRVTITLEEETIEGELVLPGSGYYDFEPVPEPTPAQDPADDKDADGLVDQPTDALVVTASTRSVPVPRVGDPLLYQQLLVPAGAAPRVVIRARLTRGS